MNKRWNRKLINIVENDPPSCRDKVRRVELNSGTSFVTVEVKSAQLPISLNFVINSEMALLVVVPTSGYLFANVARTLLGDFVS